MARKMTICIRNVAYAGVITASSIAGCGVVFGPFQELPAELAFVVQNKSLFSQDVDGPLTDVETGTLFDDLTGLSGCWGAFDVQGRPPGAEDQEVGPLLSADLPVQNYEALIFDNDTGEMRWLLYLRDRTGVFLTVRVLNGTFSVVGDDAIVLATAVGGSIHPLTGEMLLGLVDEEFEWLATLSGDHLKLEAVPDPERADAVTWDQLVFRRFDCPE